MKKRVLSLFMTLMLCLTSLPTTSLAEELAVADGTSAVETVTDESTPGETVAYNEKKAALQENVVTGHTPALAVYGSAGGCIGQEEHTWDTTTGECTKCGFVPAAKDSQGNLYDSVTDALEAVADGNGAEYVELYSEKAGSTKIDQRVEFNHPDKTAELRMNGYTLTNASSDPTLSVGDGTLRITGAAVINNEGETEAAGYAIEVSGGKLIFEADLTAQGGLTGVASNVRTRKPAVYAEGGELEFNGNLDLCGGLTLTKTAKLTHGLPQGTFWTDAYLSAMVSVKNADNYKHIYDLLADGYTYVDKSDPTVFINVNSIIWTGGNITIVEHTHKYEPEGTQYAWVCACGLSCLHPDYSEGACSVCGRICPHSDATGTGEGKYTCDECKEQMLVRVDKADGSYAFGTDFQAAMNAAEDGTKITLLADVEQSGKSRIVGGGKTVTLDLNGHKITGGWIDVGDTDNDYTSCTLQIVGRGSFETTWGSISVDLKCTLDLSGWTGGTISRINITDSSNYPVNEREAGLIVGPDAGTIQELSFGNNQLDTITRTKLSGGSYDRIYVAAHSKEVQLGSLLADAYAFQTADQTYVDYTQTLQGSYIYNLTVVKCPHVKVENGTCAYCNTENIAAMVDDTIYSSVADAIDAWLAGGEKLILYADYDIPDVTWQVNGEHTLDMNGHKLTSGTISLGNGMDLTLLDRVGGRSSQAMIESLTVNNGAKLTMEDGYIGMLKVENVADGDVKLRGGQFWANEISVPIYKLVESGYCVMNGNITVDLTKEEHYGCYYVKKAGITAAGGESGSIAIGENRVPNAVTVYVSDSNVARVQFEWYVVKDDGVAQLIRSKDEWLYQSPGGDNVCVYDPNITDGKEFADAGWKDLEVDTTYDLICVAIGKESDGAYRWQAVLKGYQMTVTKADLNSEKTVIRQKTASGNTGNPADNRLVVKPVSGYPDNLADVTYQFDVTYNGRLLTLGTDYTIKENSDTAKDAGVHELTIVGTGNYEGEKTVRWTIEPYELGKQHVSTQISKEYDGTVIADENVQGVSDLGYFRIDSSNRRNPDPLFSDTSTIYLDTCVNLTNMYFDSAEAGDRTFYFTLTLTTDNFIFADGSKTAKFELSRKEANELMVSIYKNSSDVAMPEAKDLSVVNEHAATYTVDLAEMLPKLDSPMKYGNVQYIIDSVILDSDYYTATNAAIIEDGKLKLPILASTQTGDADVGTVTVKVVSDNVVDMTLTINVKATDRIVPTGVPVLSKNAIAYGDTLSTITLSGTMADPGTNETVKGTFQWDTPDKTMDAAGTYEAAWKFIPDDAGVYAEKTGTVTITVNKATPAGEPKYTAVTAGGRKLSDAALTVNDKWPAGTLEWVDDEGNVLSGDTEVKVNTTYKWRFTPADTNYKTLTGKVELYHMDVPAISAQPKNVSVKAGEKAVFEVSATGMELTYQWQINRNDGNGFVNIDGADSAAYTSGVTDGDCNGFQYRCVISNAAGSVTTDAVVLTVTVQYTITAKAGAHGSISPSGAVEVNEGSDQTFVITADKGCKIDSLKVDGKKVNAAAKYTFKAVKAAHTIEVTFKPASYRITDGADSSWTKNKDGSLEIRGNGEFSKFRKVRVDGKVIDPKNYTVTEGSTIITLKADYLKTLSTGCHTFEIVWTDGYASTQFTVAENSGADGTSEDNNNNPTQTPDAKNNSADTGTDKQNATTPRTGDTSKPVLWLAFLMASLAGMAGIFAKNKRKDCK